MAMLPVCRVCLSDNLPLNSVKIDNLTHIYEKLTNSKYNEVGYPVSMCCICLSVLRKCHKFMETARDSNHVLKQWYNKELECKVFKARPLYCLTATTKANAEIYIQNDTAMEISQKIKKENIDDEVEKEVFIEFERMANEETNNIECNQETVPDTNTNVDFNSDTHSDSESETKPFITKEWQEDKLQLKNEAWLEVTPEITTGTPNMLNLPSWMEPGCSKNFQDAAGTNNSQKSLHITITEVKSEIGTNDDFTTNETSDDLKKAHESDTDTLTDDVYYTEASESKFIKKTDELITKKIKVNKIKTKKETETYSCNECNYYCKYRYLLIRHLKTHAGVKPITCNICGYKCRKNCELVNHMRFHTGEKPFSCDQCGYKCALKSALTRHLRTHSGEKPFSCTMCDFRCAQKFALTTHIKIHTGENLFSCDMCSYKSIEKSKLKKHLTIHTGEKPFSCNICNFKCTQKANLTAHIRIHTGEKPYSCNICSFKCKQKTHLTSHMRTHTGEKPFSCNICGYRCAQKCNLNTHLKTHATEKP